MNDNQINNKAFIAGWLQSSEMALYQRVKRLRKKASKSDLLYDLIMLEMHLLRCTKMTEDMMSSRQLLSDDKVITAIVDKNRESFPITTEINAITKILDNHGK